MAVDRYEAQRRGGGGPSAKVNGVNELVKRLQMLRTAQETETVSRRGTFGAAKELRGLIKDEVLMTTKSHTYALYRNIAFKRWRVGMNKIGYTVGVRHGTMRQIRRTKEGRPDDPYYWWFLEFGTKDIAPRGFLRRAWERYQRTARSTIMEQALREVQKAADRALKRYRDPNARNSKGRLK
jgi:HK97 gp10 family phage protein